MALALHIHVRLSIRLWTLLNAPVNFFMILFDNQTTWNNNTMMNNNSSKQFDLDIASTITKHS